VETFDRLGLCPASTDEEIWRLCQQRQIVLITGNRNAERVDSFELTIRREGTSDNLPVLTISDPDRLMKDQGYAIDVAERGLDYLQSLENLRGSGRLYLP
jgi:hypothetical protein